VPFRHRQLLLRKASQTTRANDLFGPSQLNESLPEPISLPKFDRIGYNTDLPGRQIRVFRQPVEQSTCCATYRNMQTAFLVTVDPMSLDGSVELGYGHRFKEVRRVPIDFDIANSLIAAFVTLPAGGGALCFDPVFVVELRSDDTVQWAGAACFDCGTYYSTDGHGPAGGTFDMASDNAKRLLNRIRDLA
jgi:hypothetical protein